MIIRYLDLWVMDTTPPTGRGPSGPTLHSEALYELSPDGCRILMKFADADLAWATVQGLGVSPSKFVPKPKTLNPKA